MSAAAATAGDAPRKKGKGLLIILIVVIVLLVVVGGLGAFLLLNKQHGADAHAEEAPKSAERKPPVFLPLDTFTVNLADSSARYLQTNIALQIRDEKVAEELKVYNPAVRNRVLILLSSQNGATIATPEGKAALANAIVASINGVLGYRTPKKAAAREEGQAGEASDAEPVEPGKPPVIAALFSSFIVQ